MLIFIIYNQDSESYILMPLHPRSEPCAWQRGGEVVVDVVVGIEEVHLLHSEKRNTVGEETHEVGHTARESWTAIKEMEVPTLVEWQRSTLFQIVHLAVDVHDVALTEIFEERIELTGYAASYNKQGLS